LSRKQVVSFLVLLIVVAAGSFTAGWYMKPNAPAVTEKPTVTLTIRTAYTFWGSSAPAFVALDQGYFADEGLAVTIVRGFGSSDNIKRLVAGSDPIVEIDPSLLIKSIVQQGVNATFVVPWFVNLPWSVSVLKNSSILSPKDLEGKKVGVTLGSPETLAFPFFLQAAGVDASKVTVVSYPPGSGLNTPALLAGQVDGAVQWGVLVDPIAASQNVQVRDLYYSDYGLRGLANGWVVNNDFLQKNPDVVKGFVRAFVRGELFTYQHPVEASNIQLKYVPELNAQANAMQVQGIMSKSLLDDVGKQQGIGYMSEELQAATRDLAMKMYNLTTAPPITKIFTNQFNPGIKPTGQLSSMIAPVETAQILLADQSVALAKRVFI
jgi:NitT/TauT family transport system substrate-binding protein